MSTEGQHSSSGYRDVLKTHNYDGIQEFDNPMPGWWSGIFVATIFWSAVYGIAIGVNVIPTVHDELADDMKEQATIEAAAAATSPAGDRSNLVAASADSAKIDAGAKVYNTNCAACHGAAGAGMIGPNLTDDAWLYGGDIVDVRKVVAEGTPKGMPGWGQVLSDDDLVAVVAYVASIYGSNPEKAKAAEGQPHGKPPAEAGN